MFTILGSLLGWQKWALGAVGLAVVVGGAFWAVHHLEQIGADRRDVYWTGQEAKITAAAETKFAGELLAAKSKTQELQQKSDADDVTRTILESQHEADVQKHVTGLLSGVERLRVDVVAADPAAGHAASNDPGPAGVAGTEDAVLVPATAAAVLRIAADSAVVVYDFNDLRQRYEEMRGVCNAQ